MYTEIVYIFFAIYNKRTIKLRAILGGFTDHWLLSLAKNFENINH